MICYYCPDDRPKIISRKENLFTKGCNTHIGLNDGNAVSGLRPHRRFRISALRLLLSAVLLFAVFSPDVQAQQTNRDRQFQGQSQGQMPNQGTLQTITDLNPDETFINNSAPGGLFESPALVAPPAWAQGTLAHGDRRLPPFGANLFQGHFATSYYSGLNSNYEVMPGDRVAVRIWGAKTFDEILVVDQQGNLFMPEIGPVEVAGLNQRALLNAVKVKLATVFTSQVEVYVNLMNAQPVAVYVTGFVNRPGRYAGGPTDSPLYFLDMAGGINSDQGSYRRVRVKRGSSTIANLDLYDFILNGRLPELRLQDGDVIIVDKKGPCITAVGRLRQPANYELFGNKDLRGDNLINLASPLNSVSHVSIMGVRREQPFNTYLSLEEFRGFRLNDNDLVDFHADRQNDIIMVGISGAVKDVSRYPVRKGATLAELLRHVAIDQDLANWEAVYLRRLSVAEQQKQSIHDALRRLEHSTLTATSASVDEAEIRVREAELVRNFVKRAADINPDGVVVVSRNGRLLDLPLEDGDMVVIPLRTNVVLITGEVMMPKSMVYTSSMHLNNYITSAGGFTDRADRKNILVIKPNGEVGMASKLGVGPGDRLMVMPAYDRKDMQIFKDITQVIYQIAIATGVAVGL